MYIYMHAYTHRCTYIHTHTERGTCRHTRTYSSSNYTHMYSKYTHACTQTYTHTYNLYVYIHMNAHLHTHEYICIFTNGIVLHKRPIGLDDSKLICSCSVISWSVFGFFHWSFQLLDSFSGRLSWHSFESQYYHTRRKVFSFKETSETITELTATNLPCASTRRIQMAQHSSYPN